MLAELPQHDCRDFVGTTQAGEIGHSKLQRARCLGVLISMPYFTSAAFCPASIHAAIN